MKIKDFKKLFMCCGNMNNLNINIYNIRSCKVIKEYKNYWDFHLDSSFDEYKLFEINGILLSTNSIDLWIE